MSEQSLNWTLVDTAGVSWDLNDGAVTAQAGASGFGIPTPTHWHTEGPSLDGSRWQGMRTGSRSVFLPVRLAAETSEAMLELERAFFVGLDPAREATLSVQTPDGSIRSLALRYVEGAEGEYEIDPILAGDAAYGLRFIAANPFWAGKLVRTTYRYGVATAMFPGPPFNLNPSDLLQDSTVDNPGDVPAFPKWTVRGPCSAFTVGVGTAVASMTIALAAGQWVEIDMDPRRLTIVDQAGVDRWDDTTDVAFEPIPPGPGVGVTTDVVGSGAGTEVELRFTPRYRRAW